MNFNSRRCIDVPNGSPDNGTNLQQWDCQAGNPNQSFKIQHVFSGDQALVSAHAFKCLDVTGWGFANGTNIQQWTCGHNSAQSYNIEPDGQGTYRIVNTNSRKCIDVAGAGMTDGTNIQLYECNSSVAQSFDFQMVGDNWYGVVNKKSGKCIDVSEVSTADGANVHQWTCYGLANQRWQVLDKGGYDLQCRPTPPNTGNYYADVVTRINQFRACLSIAPLLRWAEAENCAANQADYDKTSNAGHKGFSDGICSPRPARQNECPGWASATDVIAACMQIMFNEGPSASTNHFMNMTNRDSKRVGGGLSTPGGGL